MNTQTAQLSVAGAIALISVAAAQLVLNGWIMMPLHAASLIWFIGLVLASVFITSSVDWDHRRALRRARWMPIAAILLGVILVGRGGLGQSFPWPALPLAVIRGPLLIGATLIQLGVLASYVSASDHSRWDRMKKVVELGLIIALVGVVAIAVFS